MMSDIQRIAELLGITEIAAGEICIKVRSLVTPRPSIQTLTRLTLAYLEAHPHTQATPEAIARSIATNLGTRSVTKSNTSFPTQRHVSVPSSIQKLDLKPTTPPKLLSTQRKSPISDQSKPRHRSDISYDSLVEATAKLLPDKNRGNKEAARKLLKKLYSGDERLQKLSNQQMLKAIRKAYERRYFISTDTVWEAARPMLPEGRDELKQEHEISIPMGGKTDR